MSKVGEGFRLGIGLGLAAGTLYGTVAAIGGIAILYTKIKNKKAAKTQSNKIKDEIINSIKGQ